MRCRKQATAHRISSLKCATRGGSSHEPGIVHHIGSGCQFIHRISASRIRNSLPTHIFCRYVLIFITYDTWPLIWGDAGLHSLEDTRREGGLEMVEPCRSTVLPLRVVADD